jgi:hypothetical protein
LIKLKNSPVPLVLLACLLSALPTAILAQDPVSFTPDELDDLLAPIALYPDPLLAQMLLVATFPDQIDEAARYVRGGGDPTAIDAQDWDVSVKAVSHYPRVLYMMADKLDWTAALGQAYAGQPDDVFASIQRLRAEASSVDNLMSTPEEEVIDTDGCIEIWPAQAQYIYVPSYDQSVIYFAHGLHSGIRFARFPIGVWLVFDLDWIRHRVFYHGWSGGTGWIARSRPFIHLDSVYVNDRFRNVQPNRAILTRTINYASLNRYQAVHHGVDFSTVRGGATVVPASPPVDRTPKNKIIERNVNTNDGRIDQFRGHPEQPPPADRPPQPKRPPEPNRVEARPAQQPAPRAPERPAAPAFGGNRSAFNPVAASSRGQASRAEMARPAPAPRPSSPPPASRGGKR